MNELNEWACGKELHPLSDGVLSEIIFARRARSHSADATLLRCVDLLLGEVARLHKAKDAWEDAATTLQRTLDECESNRREE